MLNSLWHPSGMLEPKGGHSPVVSLRSTTG